MRNRTKFLVLCFSTVALLFLGVLGVCRTNIVKADSQDEQPPSNRTVPITGGGSNNNITGAVFDINNSGFKGSDTFMTRAGAKKLESSLRSSGGYAEVGGHGY